MLPQHPVNISELISACFFLKNVTLAKNGVAPEDDLRIEICWSDFKCFNVKFYVNALFGMVIKVNI